MKSILFVAYSGPFPAIDGKRQRTHALLRALSSRYQVDYLFINDEYDFRLSKEQFSSESIRYLNYTSQIISRKKLNNK